MEIHQPDLHHLRAAVGWLELMNAGKRKEIIARALEDPDLEPLRDEIAKLNKGH